MSSAYPPSRAADQASSRASEQGEDRFDSLFGAERGRIRLTHQQVIAAFCRGRAASTDRVEALPLTPTMLKLELDARVIAVRLLSEQYPNRPPEFYVGKHLPTDISRDLWLILKREIPAPRWFDADDDSLRRLINYAYCL